ncbi:hypothetical protein AOQ84DRAFT_291885, partial [Glonium stellatum]
NTALQFKLQGRYKRARELFLEELLCSEKSLGKQHPVTFHAIRSKASTCEHETNYADARVWYVKELQD